MSFKLNVLGSFEIKLKIRWNWNLPGKGQPTVALATAESWFLLHYLFKRSEIITYMFWFHVSKAQFN